MNRDPADDHLPEDDAANLTAHALGQLAGREREDLVAMLSQPGADEARRIVDETRRIAEALRADSADPLQSTESPGRSQDLRRMIIATIAASPAAGFDSRGEGPGKAVVAPAPASTARRVRGPWGLLALAGSLAAGILVVSTVLLDDAQVHDLPDTPPDQRKDRSEKLRVAEKNPANRRREVALAKRPSEKAMDKADQQLAAGKAQNGMGDFQRKDTNQRELQREREPLGRAQQDQAQQAAAQQAAAQQAAAEQARPNLKLLAEKPGDNAVRRSVANAAASPAGADAAPLAALDAALPAAPAAGAAATPPSLSAEKLSQAMEAERLGRGLARDPGREALQKRSEAVPSEAADADGDFAEGGGAIADEAEAAKNEAFLDGDNASADGLASRSPERRLRSRIHDELKSLEAAGRSGKGGGGGLGGGIAMGAGPGGDDATARKAASRDAESTIDTASAFNTIRRFLTTGRMPPKDALRIHEMIDELSDELSDEMIDEPIGDVASSRAAKNADEPLSVAIEAAPCPWREGRLLVRVGLRDRNAAMKPIANAGEATIEVEFDPATVASHRLVGSETSPPAGKGPSGGPGGATRVEPATARRIAAGRPATVLYEVVPVAGGPADASAPQALVTVKLRRKTPDGRESVVREVSLADRGGDFEAASADLRFAAAVAAFGMILRGSDDAGSITLDDVARIAGDAIGRDERGRRVEFLEIVRKAASLRGTGGPPRPE